MLKFSHLFHLSNSSPPFSLISSHGKNSTTRKTNVIKPVIFTKIYLAWHKDGSNTWLWEPYPRERLITHWLHKVLAKTSLQRSPGLGQKSTSFPALSYHTEKQRPSLGTRRWEQNCSQDRTSSSVSVLS